MKHQQTINFSALSAVSQTVFSNPQADYLCRKQIKVTGAYFTAVAKQTVTGAAVQIFNGRLRLIFDNESFNEGTMIYEQGAPEVVNDPIIPLNVFVPLEILLLAFKPEAVIHTAGAGAVTISADLYLTLFYEDI